MSDFAKLTSAHYLIDKYDAEEATKRINKKVKDTGYEVASITKGTAHYKNNKGNHVVSLKGTNPLNVKDLISDFKLGVGLQHHDEQFKGRKKAVKAIYKTIPDKETINLTGHSLGGSVATNVLAESGSIRDRTKKAHLFNTGYTKKFHNSLSTNLDSDERKLLNKKITHHHNTTDIISKDLQAGSIGSVNKYKDTEVKGVLEKHGLDQFIDA